MTRLSRDTKIAKEIPGWQRPFFKLLHIAFPGFGEEEDEDSCHYCADREMLNGR